MELFNMFKNELAGQQQEQQENSSQLQIPGMPSSPVNEISNHLGLDKEIVGKIMGMGLPLIMGQLGKNVQDPQGSNSLFNALDKHANNDYSDVNNIDPEDGNKILGHIFGDSKDKVSNQLGRQVGVDSDQVKKILMYMAPLALAYLANKKKQNAFDEKSIKDYTNNETEQFNGQMGGALGDILSGLGNDDHSAKKGGGLLDMITGLFGR